MIAITSLAPVHKNTGVQSDAIKSWKEHGFKVVSLNHASEITHLKTFYPDVEFVATERTMEKLFEKKYVAINALLDYAKESNEEHFLFINSDILLFDKHNVLPLIKKQSEEGITIIKRMDYDTDFGNSKRYELGIDAFFINKKFLGIFPQSIYCMGQTFWDYWIPYRAVMEGVPVFNLPEPLAYHKKHNVQYKSEDWIRMGKYFQWENNLHRYNNSIPRMSAHVFDTFSRAAR